MSDIAALVADNLDVWTGAIERKSGAGRGGGGKRISLYGIDRLRALILDLAVRGKLVSQDPADEPACALLKRLGKVREQTVKSKRSKLPSLAPVDCGSFPSGWVGACLEQIANPQAGFAFKSNDFNEQEIGLPLIRIRDVGQPFTGTFFAGEYRDEFVVREGDYLISMDGEFRVATWDGPAALLNQRVTRLQFYGQETVKRFVAIALQRELRKLQGVKAYTTVDHLSGKQIGSAFIPIPPAAEQRRIVAKVDELMALCDDLERESADALAAHQTLVETLLGTLVNSADAAELASNWARLESHFDALFTTDASVDALKQTILDLAVRGKLVEQDTGDEAASELLKRTTSHKIAQVRLGKAKRDKPLPKVKASDAPFDLPRGWAWARFPELGIFERGKSKHRPRNDPKLFQPGIYPLVQTGEVARSSGVIREFHSEYSEMGLAQSKLWPAGTLCITIAANIADAATLGFDACFPDSVVGFIPCQPIPNSQYFLYFMRTAKADLLKFAPSTAQKNINLGILETVLIPLPPLAEQQRIVAKVEELMALCDALRSRINDAGETQRHLADAITQRAAA